MPRCGLCACHEIEMDGPFYRKVGETYVDLCLFHEQARRRLVLFRQREARELEYAFVHKDDHGHATVHEVQ